MDLSLSQEEIEKIETILDFLLFDQYTYYISFSRFEQCFQPLFPTIKNNSINLFNIFKEICGPKKKYITIDRFINSYISYKKFPNSTSSKEIKIFYDILFSKILKESNTSIGKPKNNCYNYSTIKSCKNREFISNIQILTDKNDIIKGFNIIYDDVFENIMFPSEFEDELNISLDMNLGLIDEKLIKNKKIGKFLNLKENLYRDSVSHIFGNYDKNKNEVNFLGFKCISGKTVFVGKNNNNLENNEGFLFGNFGKKFHLIKLQINENGINLLNPIFINNIRTNIFIKKKFENFEKFGNKLNDELILDEKLMIKINNEEEIDKFINTPLIEDNFFFNKNLEDEISGNDYKEIINKYLIKKNLDIDNKNIEKINNINDALKKFEFFKEKRKRDKTPNNNNLKGKKNIILPPKEKKKKKKIKYKKWKNKENDEYNYNNKIKRWNGDIENINKINPSIFYQRKDNYIKLKNELALNIQQELLESEGDNISQNKELLLEQIFPEFAEIQGKNINKEKSNLKKKKLLKKQILIKNNNYDEEENIQQLFNDININEEIQKNLRAKGYTYAPLNTNITNIKQNNYYYESNNRTPAIKYNINKEYDPVKTKEAQNHWKQFNKELKKINGIYILQTIGAIIKAMNILEQNSKGKKYLFVSEKIKLLKLLEENEIIIDFLSNKNKKEEIISSDEEDDDDILIPDEHPEKIISLSQIEQNIKDIEKLLENKKLKEEQKIKLEKLKNLYIQQKNIIIENETKKIRQEIIEKNNINIDKIIKEEEQRRNLIQIENEKILEEIEKQNQNKISEEKKIIEEKKEIIINPKEIFIYKNQKIISENSSSWIDPLFKPEKNSLCPCNSQGGWIFPDKVTKSDVQGWNNYIWLRPEEIYDTKNYEIFHEGASVDDIIQGSLGDCYFLSVIGSLCNNIKLIEKLFYSLKKSKNNQYGINFYINGKWKLILIDDYFPARNTSFKKFSFSYSSNKEIWVPLLEKAWAKINGCYAKIGTGGLPNEVYDLCSEAYNEYILIKNKNKEKLWQEIFEGEKKNYLMTAGTTKNTNNFKLEKIGLTPGHAYTVLGILEINKEKVIKLRNPWGNFEFSGDWSDYSSKWTEELKIKYEFNKKNDGTFYMSYNDFLKYFITIGFCKIHPDYINNNIKIKKEKNNKCQLIKIKIEKNINNKKSNSNLVHTFIQLYQKNPRIILKDGTYQNTSLCYLILVDDEFNYIISTSSNKMHIGIEYNLNPDKIYYIFSDLNYRYENKNKNHGYRITSYSENFIEFENLTENNNYNVPFLLRKTMINYVKKNTKKSKYNGMIIYTTPSYNDYFPFLVTYFENEKNGDNLIKLNVNYKGEKEFCFYCDDIADENDTKIEKELPKNGNNIVLIMKYTLSSTFNLNYIFINDKRTEAEKNLYQNKKNKV